MRRHRNEHASADIVVNAAPTNRATGKTNEPNDERQGIPQRDERKALRNGAGAQTPHADQAGHDGAEDEVRSKICGGDHGRGAHRKCEKRPRETLREDEAEMAPGTHVAHDRHPAQAFVEEFLECAEIGDGFDDIRKKFDFGALFSDETADEEIIGGTIFDNGIAAERFEVVAGGDDGLAKSELDTVKLPSDENAGKEIGDHADGLQMLRKGVLFNGDIKAGDAAYIGIAKRCDDGAEIAGRNANVGVIDDEDVVFGFIDETNELGDFVVDGVATRAVENADLALRKVGDEFLNDGDSGVVVAADAKEEFIFGIVLAAEAGEIFVRIRVEAADWLQVADGREEIIVGTQVAAAYKEIANRAEDRQNVIDEGDRGEEQNRVRPKIQIASALRV